MKKYQNEHICKTKLISANYQHCVYVNGKESDITETLFSRVHTFTDIQPPKYIISIQAKNGWDIATEIRFSRTHFLRNIILNR